MMRSTYMQQVVVGLVVVGLGLGWAMPESAHATVSSDGLLIYGDTTNVGQLKHQSYNGTTANGTGAWGAEVSTSVGAASNIRFTVLKNVTTRNEKVAAVLKADGSLNVLLFNATSTNGWTHQFTVSGVGTTSANFMKSVDIFVERKSGDVVVVYGKTATNGSFFYRVYDGNSWTTEQTQAVTGMLGPANWFQSAVRNQSDEAAISIIDDTNDDAFAFRWDGSAWVNGVMLTNTMPTFQSNRAGVAFEQSSGRIVAVYTNVAANNAAPWKSNVFNGTSWGATTTLPNAGASSVGRWVSLDSGPDDLIAFAAQSSDNTTLTTAPTFDPYIWSGAASTSAWIKGTGDTSAGTMNQRGGDVRWEARTLDSNAAPQAIFASTQSTTALAKESQTFTYGGGFSAMANITGNNTDDIQYLSLNAADSEAKILALTNDIDADLSAQQWSGTAWGTATTTLEINLPDAAANTRTTWEPFDFRFNSYTPWMRNWRWLDDTESAIAAENATSTMDNGTIYRLRVNLQETGSSTQFAASKRLQYTTSTTPDDPSAQWFFVGEQGSTTAPWVYADGSDTPLGTIGSQILGSTTASGVYIESGFASTTHATTSVTEFDFAITPNGANENTTYYFRLYDNEFGIPVLRKQDSKIGGKCGANGLVACWYPAATMNTAPTTNISGTLYGLDRVTPNTTAGRVINVRFGTSSPGIFSTTTIAGTGVWRLNNVSTNGFTNGMAIHAWVDGDPNFRAFSFTKASSTVNSIQNFDLIQNRILLKHERFTGTNVTNTDLASYDNDNDSDIQFTAVGGGAMTVFRSQELMIAPGSEYAPGGAVTLHGNASTTNPDGDLYLPTGLRQDGTASSSILTMGSNALTLAGNWYASSSVIFSHSGTVTFNSTSTLPKMIIATSTPFTNLTFNSTGGAGSWTFGSHAATTTTAFTITAGTVTAPSSILAVGGSWTRTGNFVHNSGIVKFYGASSQTISSAMTGTNAFGNVHFSGAGTKSFGANSASTTDFIIFSGSAAVTAPSTQLTVAGNFTNSSTFTHNSGTTTFSGTGVTIAPGSSPLNNMLVTGTSITLSGNIFASSSVELTGTVIGNGATLIMGSTSARLIGGNNELRGLWIMSGTTNIQTSDLTIASSTIAATSTLNVGSGRLLTATSTVTVFGTLGGTGTTTFGNASYACSLPTSGTTTVNVRADLTAGNCTIPARYFGGNLELYSNSASAARTATLSSGAIELAGGLFVNAANTQNVTVSGSVNSPRVSIDGNLDFVGVGAGIENIVAGSGRWDIDGSLIVSDGTFTGGGQLFVGGNFTNSGGTFTHNDGELYFDGGSAQTLSGTMTGSSNLGFVTFLNSGIKTFANNASTTSFTIGSSDLVGSDVLLAGTRWEVPYNWTAVNEITTIGAGAGGAAGTNGTTGDGASGGRGGGGGAFSTTTNLSLTPGSTVIIQVGQGGSVGANGADTFFNRTAGASDTCSDTVSVCADGGYTGTGTTGGSGGLAASSVGTARNGGSGGSAGTYTSGHDWGSGGGGGGGAGGSTAAGTAGSNGAVSVSTGATAGNGGAGGGGGADNGGASGSQGTGGTQNGADGTNGGTGGTGSTFAADLYGAGGGGGGGGGNARTNQSGAAGNGGSGGLYGGGGGGGGGGGRDDGDNAELAGSGGAGANGLIVITYQAASVPVTVVAPPLLSISGSYANYSTFNANGGTVLLDGNGLQNIVGNATGTSAFYNLTILNVSGDGNDTQSVLFQTAASTTNIFTMIDSTSAGFLQSATSSFAHIVLNGTIADGVWLRSITPSTRAGFVVTSSALVDYVDVKDISSCGDPSGISIAVTTIGTDSGNNCGWTFVGASPTIDQLHYRFRLDDGDQVFASGAAAEDTPITSGLYTGERRRLRFTLSNSGTAAATNYTYRLEVASTSCAAWLPVGAYGTTESHWVMDETGSFLEFASTTDWTGLTNPGGKTFTPGYAMTLTNQTMSHSLTTSQFTEMEFSIKATNNVAAETLYCFRLTNGGSTANFVYTVQPQVTIRPATLRPVGGGPRNQTGENEGHGNGTQRSGGGQSGGGGGSESGGGGGSQQGGGGAGGGGGVE